MALWDKISSRGNVEDRRGQGGMIALGGGGLSLGGIALLIILNYVAGGNPLDVLHQLPLNQISVNQNAGSNLFEGADDYEVFTSTVIGSTNDYWTSEFNKNNKNYEPPKLVLFRGATNSQCGYAASQMGPHYCPNDSSIYIDETFFDELQSRFGGGSGDVAQAYVMAHEVGHHVQNLMGTLSAVQSSGNSNELSIKQELQSDCYAGLWAHSIKDKGVFEDGEIKEALDAASAVGDDRIQQNTQGSVTPETWTHGSSEDRVKWFTTGYQTGSLGACNTFNN